jgi:hypothetical protein
MNSQKILKTSCAGLAALFMAVSVMATEAAAQGRTPSMGNMPLDFTPDWTNIQPLDVTPTPVPRPDKGRLGTLLREGFTIESPDTCTKTRFRVSPQSREVSVRMTIPLQGGKRMRHGNCP